MQDLLIHYKGLCKVKQNPKIQNNLDGDHPTHHPASPSKIVLGNPSLTWREHSNHNNQQRLAMYIQTEYIWYTTPKY